MLNLGFCDNFVTIRDVQGQIQKGTFWEAKAACDESGLPGDRTPEERAKLVQVMVETNVDNTWIDVQRKWFDASTWVTDSPLGIFFSYSE